MAAAAFARSAFFLATFSSEVSIRGLDSSISLYDVIDMSFSNIFSSYNQVEVIVPGFDQRLQSEFIIFQNLFGTSRGQNLDGSTALSNAENFALEFQKYYRSMGLKSPNRGGWGAFTNSFGLSFSLDFLQCGVRNNYGEIPRSTQFYLDMLTNPNLYYSNGGDYLLKIAYSKF